MKPVPISAIRSGEIVVVIEASPFRPRGCPPRSQST
jgi:hypothetical protein